MSLVHHSPTPCAGGGGGDNQVQGRNTAETLWTMQQKTLNEDKHADAVNKDKLLSVNKGKATWRLGGKFINTVE